MSPLETLGDVGSVYVLDQNQNGGDIRDAKLQSEVCGPGMTSRARLAASAPYFEGLDLAVGWTSQ